MAYGLLAAADSHLGARHKLSGLFVRRPAIIRPLAIPCYGRASDAANEGKMRGYLVFVLACLAFAAVAGPVSAHRGCRGAPCAYRPVVTLAKCCRRAPAGWGWYLREKLRNDCTPPLAIYDELGGVTLLRDRR